MMNWIWQSVVIDRRTHPAIRRVKITTIRRIALRITRRIARPIIHRTVHPTSRTDGTAVAQQAIPGDVAITKGYD